MPERDAAAPSRALIIVAAVLGLGLVAAVAVIGLSRGDRAAPPSTNAPSGPLPLAAAPAPDAGSAACRDLVDALPGSLESADEQLSRRKLLAPAPEGAAAWGEVNPVVLRCGIPRPPGLRPTSRLRQINGVQWLPVPERAATTWYAVDRRVYVALTVPADGGTGPLQQISDTIERTLRVVKPRA